MNRTQALRALKFLVSATAVSLLLSIYLACDATAGPSALTGVASHDWCNQSYPDAKVEGEGIVDAAEEPEGLMPFWLALLTSVSKSAVTILILGPPSAVSEAVGETRLPGGVVLTAEHKARAKSAFTASLFSVMLYTLYSDASELVALWARSDGLLHFYVGAVAVLVTSPNLVTGLTWQAFWGVYAGAARWRILHSGPAAEELDASPAAARAWQLQVFNDEWKRANGYHPNADALERQGTLGFFYTGIPYGFYVAFGIFTFVLLPLLPGLVLYLPVMWCVGIPGGVACRAMTRLIMVLRSRRRAAQGHAPLTSDGYQEKTDVGQMRAVLARVEPPLTISRVTGMAEDEVREEYSENARCYDLTGSLKDAWIDFFFFQLVIPVSLAIAAASAARLYAYLDVASPGRLWARVLHGDGWEALQLAYVRALSRTLWERRTWVYLRHLQASVPTQLRFYNALF